MTYIRFRLFLILFLTLGASVFGTYRVVKLNNEKVYYEELIEQSYLIESEIHKLNTSKFHKKQFEHIQKIRESMHSKNRQEFVSELLVNYGKKHFSLFKKNLLIYNKNELEYRKHFKVKKSNVDKKIFYAGGFLVALGSATILVVILFLQFSFFRQIKDLSKKMMDFVNRKYSYQFSIPPNNEIGELQINFNAMAQKVLTRLDDLESLDHAKSEFLSIASHELRTPLTSIKGSLSLLKSGVTEEFNEATVSLLDIAEVESDRLIRLINDILDLTKIEARQFPLNLEWIILSDLINRTFQSLFGLAQTAKVQLTQEGFENIYVQIDSDRIQQVITNLLSNAIKFSPENGKITVSATVSENQHLVIEVIDQGPGISPEDQQFIFQKFRQATGPNNPLVKGTGLGLAIAKALIEEHSGEINVNSSPGFGSNFFFTLPEWKYKHGTKSLHQSTVLEEKVRAGS
ncbi:MAG: HAMP domain-containing histidine kinase [Bdellovibrionaceae bacterium]|jgi:signal transduction histidine kinase|nr:HAMP domain-containing histidine kinase [Pseudobdellovibrionaceae bacterium]